MDLSLTDEFMDLMAKERAFFLSAAKYSAASPEAQKYDMLAALGDEGGREVTLRLISQGYLSIRGQDIVWCKLLFCIFNANVQMARQAIECLGLLDGDEAAAFKADCLRIVGYYASECDDAVRLMLALVALETLGYRDEMAGYIEAHNDRMGLEDEIVAEYKKPF